MQQHLEQLKAGVDTQREPQQARLGELCALVNTTTRQCFHKLKLAVREGVMVFERYEAQTMASGRAELMEAVRRIPAVVESYYLDLAQGIGALEPAGSGGERLKHASEAATTFAALPGHGGQVDYAALQRETEADEG